MVDTDELPSYADYDAIPNKDSLEAQGLLTKVETLYFRLAHDPQNAQYMDNNLFEDIFNDIYNDCIGNRLVDCWTDPTVMNGYFDALEQAFRDKATSLPDELAIPGATPETLDAAVQLQKACKVHLLHSADRILWLKVLNEELPVWLLTQERLWIAL